MRKLLYTVLGVVGLMGTLTIGVVNAQEVNKDIIIEATATESGQTLKINKYFSNAYTVSRCDGCGTSTLSSDTGHTYEEPGTYTITLSLTGTDRWKFQNINKPLIPTSGTTMAGIKIISMPSLASGFGVKATNPGTYFFYSFNNDGEITSLPTGSFDTSNITTAMGGFFSYFNNNGKLTSLPNGSFDTSNISGTVGTHVFSFFNRDGQLTSLPTGSFDTSNITTVGDSFFSNFSRDGQLTSLPTGSFDTSNITTVGNGFFNAFNQNGKLTNLPDGSFDTSNISGTVGTNFFSNFSHDGQLTSLPTGSFDTSNITTVGNNFFNAFNQNGKLTNLPDGSFDTSNISGTVGNAFFTDFNHNGQLTSLPTGSFDTSKITTVGSQFFSYFNYKGKLTSLPTDSFNTSNITAVGTHFFISFNGIGALTSLPTGSFDTSNISGTVGNYFFHAFNSDGQLTSLPTDSFNTSNITTVRNYFFSYFNYKGKLTSLPTGSFNTNNITTVGDSFFSLFNNSGKLTNLPTDSFNTSNITSVGDSFFSSFNRNGEIRDLPESFKLTSAAYNKANAYTYTFNSTATINRKVSDLVTGVTAPSSDQNTFSDNQPGRCGVHTNWLQNITNACSITYDTNGGSVISSPTKKYNANITGVAIGNGITAPTRVGYTFGGWQNASGENVDEVLFPEMDGETLYARWTINEYFINYKLHEGVVSGENVTGYTVESEDITLINPTKTGYTFIGRSGTDIEGITGNVTIPKGSTGDRNYETNWVVNEYTITFVDGSGENENVLYSGTYESTVTTEYPEWTKEGYTIHWDKEIPTTMPLSGDTITTSWTINQYTITLDIDGNITTITGDYGSPITKPTNPTRNGYRFVGWEPEIPDTMPAKDIIIKAVREKLGSSGGGGGKSSKDVISNESEKSTEQPTGNQVDSSAEASEGQNDASLIKGGAKGNEAEGFSEEFQQAYEFAHENGITTMPTIQKADMDGKLTRIAMAKMLSQYAMNILGQKPANIVVPKFSDISEKLDADYDNGVTLAYQLGIMGQNMPDNKFRPNDEVTRAEFATALSRMLYNTSDGEYKSTPKYYLHHMEKLVKEGIITNDNPNMKELRGYVMIMLMRSAK